MASQAPQNTLPLFYKDLVPISSQEHGSWRARPLAGAHFVRKEHAIPITIDEFAVAQRFYPIIFATGDNPVPLALMGLNEGVNTFFGEDGMMVQDAYLPAYIRRYPYMLARLRPDTDELSLCVDPTAEAIGPFEEGDLLFDGDQPSEAVKSILAFCEQFEQAGQRTAAFVAELKELDLLIDGEVTIQTEENAQPFIYRGFQMVAEEKLRDLRGDTLRKMMKSGLLPLVHAHLFSLGIMREIFGRQIAQNTLPENITA
ncbi:SapC family protein [Sphingomonas sp.]|uniref:SapC family protein n=1 Tax=Sphingomonas sp. TaxID=28214 RepID=UPI0025F2229F|nr:SapC family protein [Sphingomonas sp.]